MFDRITAKPSSGRWRTFLIIGTVAGHAAVLTALVLVAFWRIEKLPISDDREILVSVATEPQAPAAAAAGTPLEVIKVPKEPPKVIPTDIVQKTEKIETDPQPPGGPTGQTGDGTATVGPPTGGTCTTPPCGGCLTPPCGTSTETTVVVVEKKDPPKVEIVPPDVAAGLRLSGTEKIYPPDSVRVSMVHASQDTLQATIKLCVDTGGAISSVKMLRSTGHDAYDSVLLREMRHWRYRPYKVNGVPAPMCTVQLVIYRMKN